MGGGDGISRDKTTNSEGGGAKQTLKRVFSRQKYETLENETMEGGNNGGRSIEVLPGEEGYPLDPTQWTKIDLSTEDIEIKQGKIKAKKAKRKEKRKRVKKAIWRKTKGGWKCFKAGMALISTSAIGAFSFTSIVTNTASLYASHRRPV